MTRDIEKMTVHDLISTAREDLEEAREALNHVEYSSATYHARDRIYSAFLLLGDVLKAIEPTHTEGEHQ